MDDPEIRNSRASRWMKRGIALLNQNTAASLSESLRWFEGAIQLRRSLPLPENSWYRYVLAAGWMNRGDALTRLGSQENLAEAVRSYDHALTLLRTLDLQSNSPFRQRLALAWMNRGITLQGQGSPASLRAALASFDETIALLRDPRANDGAEYHLILGCALTNRSNLLLWVAPPSPSRSRESAAEALALVREREEGELLAAETGLKARHILCQAIALQLADRATTIATEDLVAAATDAIEDGLALARHWEARGERRFRDLAAELFRFGARTYQMHQSHFLTEFVLANLDPLHSRDAFPTNPEMHSSADEAIAHTFAEIRRDAFGALTTPRFDRLLETVRQLRVTEARLDELRRGRSFVAAEGESSVGIADDKPDSTRWPEQGKP